jgi:glycosyltransferase involved in cell wall biosynthesis
VKEPRIRILLAGPMPPPVGGTAVLFQCLIAALEPIAEVEALVLNTQGVRNQGLRTPLRLIRLIFRVFAGARKADVLTVHTSTTGLHLIGTFAYLASRLFRRPLVIRKFGGSPHRQVVTLRGLIADYLVRHADLYLVETRQLVIQATNEGLKHVCWFPNHRHLPAATKSDNLGDSMKNVCRRFVYIGHVRANKGIHVLAETARRLPADVSIDVYGPLFDDLKPAIFDNCPNLRYFGTLAPDEVITTLREYDATVLPTVAATEGYPGVVIESYIAGLPIVVSRIGGIPEIVDDSVGILVKPGDSEELYHGMMKLVCNPRLFQRLAANTRAKAEFFSSQRRVDEFVVLCREVLAARQKTPVM